MPKSRIAPSPSLPIAVIGMALRVPGATSTHRFWRNLVEGRDCLSRPSADALRHAIVGNVLTDPIVIALRRVAQEQVSADVVAG